MVVPSACPSARRAVLLAHTWTCNPSFSRRWPVRSTPVLPLRIAFLFVVPFVPLVAQQTGTVSGTVVATESGAPLVGASVVVVGTARSVLTNEKGLYHLSVPAGAHSVRARLIGYEAAEERVVVPAGQTVTVDFKLTATPLSLNEVVVVGARTSRTAVETPVPVDVITSQEVQETGHTEVNQILATLAPSFNASHQTIADGSDHINPASLRGLGPDQVLVLVNGKRRHPPALVHVNGTFGRGTVGVDLNAIPTAAIERIEVLRDGAAAQYGSDAIAGVINIVLKQQTERLEASSTVGTTPGGTAFGDITDKHDGDQVKADANYGFAIGDRGYFNVTAEYLDRGATNRASTWSGPIFVKPVPGSPTAYTDSLRKIDDDSLATLGLTRAPFTMNVGQAQATLGTRSSTRWCRSATTPSSTASAASPRATAGRAPSTDCRTRSRRSRRRSSLTACCRTSTRGSPTGRSAPASAGRAAAGTWT